MRLTRRHFLASSVAAATLPRVVMAYPEKPITIVVPFPPGGRTDVVARLFANVLGTQLGQSVVVSNKAGAGGAIGQREVALARPDGRTLGVFSTAAITSQYMLAKPVLLKDFAAIRTINTDPMAIAVSAASPWRTVSELVAYANSSPGMLRVGMIAGASSEIFAPAFANAARIQTYPVPFKGDADGAVAVAGGYIDVHVGVPASYRALSDARKLRVLGIAAAKTSAPYGGLPTLRESGVDLVMASFHMLFAPRGTPTPIIRRLEAAAGDALSDASLRKQFEAQNLGHANLDMDQTQRFLAEQDAVYRRIIESPSMRTSRL